MTDGVWGSAPRHTTTELLLQRADKEPDSEYLDVCGTKLTAGEVVTAAAALGGALRELGVGPGDRVATLLENSPEALLVWWATQWAGAVAVPVNTAYKGEYLRHQLRDSGSTVLVVGADLADRAQAVSADLDGLRHVVVTGPDALEFPGATAHRLDDLLAATPLTAPVERDPSDLATFIYTGGTTGLSKGCMLSHNYHEALAQQIGYSWGRTASDVLWTPLPMFHYNALVTAVVGALVFGGRSAIYRKFSVSNFWPEMNRTGATITSTLGTMAYLLAHDVDRPEMPRSGAAQANSSLRLMGAAPLPPEVDDVIRERFGIETFSGAYGVTEASLISWQPPGVRNRPRAAGVINTRYFDVRIFDDSDVEQPRGTDGEIVIRPKLPHVMFEGYWGRPEATVEASRNWWYHTGDIGKIDEDGYLYFVDRKADYLRRRGENIASFEVERILMGHGQLADVAVHAVPSKLTEDDVKVTAILTPDATLTEEELFRWCVDALPYFALPRYIEFRAELPRSPVGRVLKRELRAEGVTAGTWDVEAAGITYDKR
ncbi:crotonobetaine/carnitine-CoA ligase [Parafrankia irregularis]|uniref:Crotonobetaine/carnitine-CoA ligase n=1 Tax=Parafrankia irregularis TaxID=795642 RepID=A0A0S4QJZ5_9ACTN|nr:MULTISPECIES: AMP-binding protein [Parafrankia]MBE3200756.1 AMP-binding protein [Parafrankia sp. CH37]CUU54858.1 crotonobetaine/carnitine-CoA ligase [Parafrankia irregularis]